MAIIVADSNKQPHMVKYLLSRTVYGVIPMLELLLSVSGERITGLHDAILHKRDSTVEWLIEHNAPCFDSIMTHVLQCKAIPCIIDASVDYGVPIYKRDVDTAHDLNRHDLADRLEQIASE